MNFHVKDYNLKKDWVVIDPLSGDTLPAIMQVGCGHCDECIGFKVSRLRKRMLLEMATYGYGQCYFVTLTYDDSHLPADGVCKTDVQLFLKRLRVNLSRKYKGSEFFRYFCASEYGTDTQRAHYHLVLFGLDVLRYMSLFSFKTILADSWRNGFVYVRMCDAGAANYCSKYLYKGSVVPEGKNPCFYLSSRGNGGLGVHYFYNPEHLENLFNSPDGRISVNCCGRVKEVIVPPCIIKRIFGCTLEIARYRYQKLLKCTLYSALWLRAFASERCEHLGIVLPTRKEFEKKFPFIDFSDVKLDFLKCRKFVAQCLDTDSDEFFCTHVLPEIESLVENIEKINKISVDLDLWIKNTYLCEKQLNKVYEYHKRNKQDDEVFDFHREASIFRARPDFHS
ncbi:replication initiator protein [Peromfec virus RodF8_14]|uniref:Replication initiator protein n=1 Tax=Peromfec virus RodF8_14 TaxID=2929359 RepID=A0A976N2C2_9VIRU|nr:replication initiator protein [Peromfec virus RodF8_14]